MSAMLLRCEWAYRRGAVPVYGTLTFPESGGAVTRAHSNTIFTMHGLIMIFFAITPILIGAFGNLCIPLMIGARDMAFPALNRLSVWTMVAATATLTASFFVPLGAPQAGGTAYATLSTATRPPALAQTP